MALWKASEHDGGREWVADDGSVALVGSAWPDELKPDEVTDSGAMLWGRSWHRGVTNE